MINRNIVTPRTLAKNPRSLSSIICTHEYQNSRFMIVWHEFTLTARATSCCETYLRCALIDCYLRLRLECPRKDPWRHLSNFDNHGVQGSNKSCMHEAMHFTYEMQNKDFYISLYFRNKVGEVKLVIPVNFENNFISNSTCRNTTDNILYAFQWRVCMNF